MKLVLFVMASIAWFVPQQIAELNIPVITPITLKLESTATYNSQELTTSFTEKSVASNRKMRHRTHRSEPSQSIY